MDNIPHSPAIHRRCSQPASDQASREPTMPMISVAPPPALHFPRLTLTMPPPMITLPDRAHADAPRPPPPLLLRHAAAKNKAVVAMGATATGKSRLAIGLALRFGGEVINSDKIQAHAGLDVATNKVSPSERAGVPHHLLGLDEDFCRKAASAVRTALARGYVPVVAGGSSSYVEELVEGERRAFRERYDFVARPVDDMCRLSLVDEVAAAFDARRTDYSRGVWRAIGIPELDACLRSTGAGRRGRAREHAHHRRRRDQGQHVAPRVPPARRDPGKYYQRK
ncbi:hypothetical protein CFC21_007969 [Triticum aestivum]|uniref:Uncharacterized protein n=2 Tax=Triticum aestivum TaxID=4565 RepID=A0A3B5Z176_WHEAT|nr:hypothetical protein CFC21_007969 [Triticum aestivum]